MGRPSSCSEQPNEVCNLSSLYAQLLGCLQRLGCCLFPIEVVSLGLCWKNAQMWRITGKATMLFVDVDAVDGAKWVQTYTYAFAGVCTCEGLFEPSY